MQLEMKEIIGIGGGVGPMAGVELHKKIIENTDSGGTDQGHIEVFHISNSADITERNQFLEGIADENPADGMFRSVQAMEYVANRSGKQLVVGIPCNTFHVPEVFDRFLELLQQSGSKIQVKHLLEETAHFMKATFPNAKKIGLLTITPTRKIGVFKQFFQPPNYQMIEISNEMQVELQNTVNNPNWGIKAVSPASGRARQNLVKFVRELRGQGAESIVLGCSELPLALPEKQFEGIPLIDPVLVLARALIREVAEEKLRPLK